MSELAAKRRPAGRCRPGSDTPAPRRKHGVKTKSPPRKRPQARKATRVLRPCLRWGIDNEESRAAAASSYASIPERLTTAYGRTWDLRRRASKAGRQGLVP